MPKITNEDKEKIEEKLKYIGLDLDTIPEFLKEYKPLEYRPIKSIEDHVYKVYKYIPISKIQILLTPTNRLNTIQEKYSQASPLYSYIDLSNEDNIEKYTTFLRMLKNSNIDEIEAIEKEQKELNEGIPFKVKFYENYLWQIYYSESTDIYFMLVPTEDLEYSAFFYLLKKQIEISKSNKEEMIFVPISYEQYSNKYLKKSEFKDIEKYLWLFTKNWPLTYEVYDKKGDMSIQIVGTTICYENIKSYYKMKLDNIEEANKFYKLLKALFILQTELPHYYMFKVKIDKYAALEFELNGKKINYDNMFKILQDEYKKAKDRIEKLQIEKVYLEEELEKSKDISNKKEEEYLQKEKQIATYLECRKTFFGKVKYFIKVRKNKKKKNVPNIEESTKKTENTTKQLEKIEIVKKEYYTIDDVVKIYKELDKIIIITKNLRIDLLALNNKIKSLELKIKNATLYIDEIDRHEKSIFEFWKFANKDENLLLNQGVQKENKEQKKIEKVFDYEEDFKDITRQIDKIQRNNLSKPDTDAIFISTTNLIELLNNIGNDNILNTSLENLKEELENQKVLFDSGKIDIFGGISDYSAKTKILDGNKHRETEKDKLQILEIYKDMEINEYKQKIEDVKNRILEAIKNSKSPISLSIYKSSIDTIEMKDLQVLDIRPSDSIDELKDEDNIQLYRINIKQGMPIIYFSNTIYFDNYNKTLPFGMDVQHKCLINMNMYNLKFKKKSSFRIVKEINESKVKVERICVNEYDAEMRDNNGKQSNSNSAG